MSVIVPIKTQAPQAKMHERAAERFDRLREILRVGSGVDFLARCGDVFRDAGFVSDKDGVANRSWHKTGRAFDYDQTSPHLVLVSEKIAGKQFFRTFLICAEQDGSQGVKRLLRDFRGGSCNSYVFDFTAAAKTLGFVRIPAWSGWQQNYNRREFWHYEFREGLTWNAAMLQLRGKQPVQKVIGLNDRGAEVVKIQRALHKAGLLPEKEIDGIFGARTRNAVTAFQRFKNIAADGLVGNETRSHLGI